MAVYLPQFEKTMFEAGADSWPDNAKITTLVGGLNKYTRQRIDRQFTLPTTYNEFIQMLQTLGNQFGPIYSNGNGNGNAMEWESVRVSATRNAPHVTREQRQLWRDNGKCVRCGSGNHWVKTCDHQPTRGRSFSSSSKSSINSKAMVQVNTVQPARTKTTARPSKPLVDSDGDSDGYGGG
jgi:hypothetical protein